MRETIKYLSLGVGVLILLPIDLLFAFGLSFTVSSNLKIDQLAFILLACLMDIPALAISFVKPRIGSVIIFSAAAISLAMATSFFAEHHQVPTRKVALQSLAFWGLKALVSVALLIISYSKNLDRPESQTDPAKE